MNKSVIFFTSSSIRFLILRKDINKINEGNENNIKSFLRFLLIKKSLDKQPEILDKERNSSYYFKGY